MMIYTCECGAVYDKPVQVEECSEDYHGYRSSEIAALVQDAARYRWIRATFNRAIGDGGPANAAWNAIELGGINALTAEQLDVAIDLARVDSTADRGSAT